MTFNDLLNQDAYDRAVRRFFLNNYRMAPETLRSALQFNFGVRAIEEEFRRGWNYGIEADSKLEQLTIRSLSRFRHRPTGGAF